MFSKSISETNCKILYTFVKKENTLSVFSAQNTYSLEHLWKTAFGIRSEQEHKTASLSSKYKYFSLVIIKIRLLDMFNVIFTISSILAQYH